MTEQPVPDLFGRPTEPMVAARQFEAEWWVNEHDLIGRRYWQGSWWEWVGPHWREVPLVELRKLIYNRLDGQLFRTWRNDEEQLNPWAPTRAKVNDVIDAICATDALTPDDIMMPTWLDREDDRTFVPCRNGLLSCADRALLSQTPAFLNGWSLDLDYDKDAACPTWLGFLESVWPDDHESQWLLQEWFGYVISGRTDLQKMLLIIGPPRSGKGTISKTLTRLLGGYTNVAGPTLHSLSSNFGLSSLLGKPLAIMNDTRNARSTDIQVVTERLLSITGEDQVDVDRKNKAMLSVRLPTRVMMMSNELPNFRDTSGAIVKRLLTLRMVRSFFGQEDLTLEGKIMRELPGVLNWALDGIDRLTSHGGMDDGVMTGRFTTPRASENVVEQLREAGSKMGSFIAEECVLGAGCWVSTEVLCAAYAAWDNDNRTYNDRGFQTQVGNSLISAAPEVRRVRRRMGGNRTYVYEGIALVHDVSDFIRNVG